MLSLLVRAQRRRAAPALLQQLRATFADDAAVKKPLPHQPPIAAEARALQLSSVTDDEVSATQEELTKDMTEEQQEAQMKVTQRDNGIPEEALPWISIDWEPEKSDPEDNIDAAEDQEGLLGGGIPMELLEGRTAYVYRPSRDSQQECSNIERIWKVEFDIKPFWTNQLMKYSSGADALYCAGVPELNFPTKEAAVKFCKRQGIKYEVEEPLYVRDFEGVKSYDFNFMNQHVFKRKDRLGAEKLLKSQFAHGEAGKTAWVNLKHSRFGANQSKAVSQTKWSEAHPGNHKASDWYRRNIVDRQELARRLGK